MKNKLYILYIFVAFGLVSCVDYDDGYFEDETGVSPYTVNWVAAADSSTTSFVNRYWNTTSHCFNNTYEGAVTWNDYWPEAHGLDLLIDAYLRTNDAKYKQAIYDWYEGVRKKNWYSDNWENEFYDDMGWHGLAHMRALEVTGDQRYAASSKDLWNWITKGWSDYQGGGIQWRKGSDQKAEDKGIPANGPAAIIAARRYKMDPNETVDGLNGLEWSKKIYEWMKHNRTIITRGRVFENLNNTENDYSYDVGTYLGAALELYSITNDKTYWEDAIRITKYHIANNIDKDNGVMRDHGEQSEGGNGHDCNLFKGIFVRYFTILIQHPELSPEDKARFVSFLKKNAEFLWTRGTQKVPDIKFSYTWWRIPPETEIWGDLRSAISGATTIEAMALLQEKGLLN